MMFDESAICLDWCFDLKIWSEFENSSFILEKVSYSRIFMLSSPEAKFSNVILKKLLNYLRVEQNPLF